MIRKLLSLFLMGSCWLFLLVQPALSSMHQVEAYVEEAVHYIAESDWPTAKKRNTIHTLFELMSQLDTGFTNLRTTKEMVASQYTFLFDKTEMYDYQWNKKFYEEELPRKSAFDQGDLYICESPDGLKLGAKICVDSGSLAWEKMVGIGAINGEGAEPVKILPTSEALRESKKLVGDLDDSEYLLKGYLWLLSLDEGEQSLYECFSQLPEDKPRCLSSYGFTGQEIKLIIDQLE